jgi:hypothetical protein
MTDADGHARRAITFGSKLPTGKVRHRAIGEGAVAERPLQPDSAPPTR